MSHRKKTAKRTQAKKGGYLSRSDKTHRVRTKTFRVSSRSKTPSLRKRSVLRASNKSVKNEQADNA